MSTVRKDKDANHLYSHFSFTRICFSTFYKLSGWCVEPSNNTGLLDWQGYCEGEKKSLGDHSVLHMVGVGRKEINNVLKANMEVCIRWNVDLNSFWLFCRLEDVNTSNGRLAFFSFLQWCRGTDLHETRQKFCASVYKVYRSQKENLLKRPTACTNKRWCMATVIDKIPALRNSFFVTMVSREAQAHLN